MIRLPPQVAVILAGLWSVLLGATTQFALPGWAHFVIVAVGGVLAGLGIIPEPQTGEPPGPQPSESKGPWE